MKTTKFLQKSVVSLGALLLLGCTGENNSYSQQSITQLGTMENAKLVLKIDAADQKQPQETVETNSTNTQPTNILPTAVATANGKVGFITTTTGETVYFDSNESTDIDGNIISYIWTDMDHNILSKDPNFKRAFYYSGIYEKTLSITDDKGGVARDRICILVDITKDEIPMMANAGPDIVTTPNTNITLEGRVICKDGNFSYSWSENDKVLANTKSFGKTYEEGVHTVVLEIKDNQTGYKAWDTVDITVKAANEDL